MDELTKSIRAVLYDRIKSPLAGTLFLSWITWNWKIVVLLLFISESKVTGTKIEYILSNYNDVFHLIWGPIISAVLLVTVFPIISYSAYWLSLHFKKWHVNSKNKIEGETLMTIKKSRELKNNIRKQEADFAADIKEKDDRIVELEAEIKDLRNTMISPAPIQKKVEPKIVEKEVAKKELTTESLVVRKFITLYENDVYIKNTYNRILNKANKTKPFPIGGSSPTRTKEYLLKNNFITDVDDGLYLFTEDGNKFADIVKGLL